MLAFNELILFSVKMGVSGRMNDYEQIIFHKYSYDLSLTQRTDHFYHQTFNFIVTFIQSANNLHLIFFIQPILWPFLSLLNVFFQPILQQVFLLQLFLWLLLVFVFPKLQPARQQFFHLLNVFIQPILMQSFLLQDAFIPPILQQLFLLQDAFIQLILEQLFLLQDAFIPLILEQLFLLLDAFTRLIHKQSFLLQDAFIPPIL